MSGGHRRYLMVINVPVVTCRLLPISNCGRGEHPLRRHPPTQDWRVADNGLTPEAEVVAGVAGLVVDFPARTGRLAFTELETWGLNEVPGAVGTGSPWLDGELSYRTTVRGNAFVGTHGDQCAVRGTLFGESHEGIGGVLRRDDFGGGFGGRR